MRVAKESFRRFNDDTEKYKMSIQSSTNCMHESTKKDHPKVPRIGTNNFTGTAGQNIMLALNALGYGAIWSDWKISIQRKDFRKTWFK